MKSPFCTAYTGMLLLLGATWIASHLTSGRTREPLLEPLSSISPEIAGWKLATVEELPPGKAPTTSYLARTYVKGGSQLGLLIGFHDSYQGAINVHNPKNCLPGEGWEIWKTSSPKRNFDGRPVIIKQYQIYRMSHRMVVFYWYQSRGRVVANEYLAKIMLVRDGLLERRSSGSFVRIALPDQPELLPDGLRFAEAVMHYVRLCFYP